MGATGKQSPAENSGAAPETTEVKILKPNFLEPTAAAREQGDCVVKDKCRRVEQMQDENAKRTIKINATNVDRWTVLLE